MAPNLKRAETFDEYTTQRVDVIQNKLFGDIKICARQDNNGYIPSEDELTSN